MGERGWKIIPHAFVINTRISFEPLLDQSATFSWFSFLKNNVWVFKRKCSADLDINSSLKTWGINALLTFFFLLLALFQCLPYPQIPGGRAPAPLEALLCGGSSSSQGSLWDPHQEQAPLNWEGRSWHLLRKGVMVLSLSQGG